MNEKTNWSATRASKTAAAAAVLAAAVLCMQHAAAQSEIVDAVIDEQAKAESAARTSQIRIAQLDEEATQMLGEYRQVVAEADNLETYNKQLAAQVESQEEEIGAMLTQLEEIETTASEVMPLMQRMLETLGQFVELDMPFLLDERRMRVENLEGIMRRADVSVSERYRRIVEAYSVEMEYGRTIESYRDEISNGAEPRSVDLLRVGRVALLYQTLDGAETGYWDAVTKEWIVDDSYRSAVRDGLRIAKQQAAPGLMIAPVRSPKESEL
jgi:chromosome segregation ATPase